MIHSRKPASSSASRAEPTRAAATEPPGAAASDRKAKSSFSSTRAQEAVHPPSQSLPATPLAHRVKCDAATPGALVALDSVRHLEERLNREPGPPTPALMDELARYARKRTLEAADPNGARVFGGLIEKAGGAALGYDLVKPVFRALLRGPQMLDANRLTTAMSTLCAPFADHELPDEWLRALLHAARDELPETDLKLVALMTCGALWASADLQPDPARRAAQDARVLQLALQDAAQAPDTPIALIAWLHGATARTQPVEVAHRVLQALDEMPRLEPGPLGMVMMALGAGTVMPLATDGSPPGQPLKPLLAWALKLPETHRSHALAGLIESLSRAGEPPDQPWARLRTALRVAGELEREIHAAGAQGLVGALFSQLTVGGEAAVLPERPPGAGDSKTGPRRGAAALEDDWPTQALGGLRAALVGRNLEPFALEPHLPALGEALAAIAGGRTIAAPALQALVAGIARSDIAAPHAGLLVGGLAGGAGATALAQASFDAIARGLAAASDLRAAEMLCHFSAAIGTSGQTGRTLPTPLARRMEHAIGPLPTGLALGCQLADAPLAAVRASQLPAAEQLHLLTAACQVRGGLDATVMAEQMVDCALLAGQDVDFAIEAAIRLVDHSGEPLDEPILRQLRAGLLAHALPALALPAASSSEPASGMPPRLERLSMLYERACRGLWVTHAEFRMQGWAMAIDEDRKGQGAKAKPAADHPRPPQAFLASEIALMRQGPRAQVLEPLAAKLERMARALNALDEARPASTDASPQPDHH